MLSHLRPLGATCLLSLAAHAQEPAAVLFRDVRVFDGVSAELFDGHVLVQGERIARVSREPLTAPAGALVIDGNGRVLSPGFIDLHSHLALQMPRDQLFVHPTVAGGMAADAARRYLAMGFTSVRDAGGTHPDFARAVDAGQLLGPRIFPSGGVITQTAGHGDFRAPHDPHPTLDHCGARYLSEGLAWIADGVPETLAAVRENLRHGATQIKIMGGGGVMSDYDPIHTLQPSPEEIRAAVQAAGDWGTYVMAHAYTSEAVRRLVENGVRVIEHGLLIDEETAQLCAERDVVISTQVLIFRTAADLPGVSERNREKLAQVLAGQDHLMQLVRRHGLKIGFGTDLVFGSYVRVPEEFTARLDYFTPAEILRQATSESAQVIRLCGKLNLHGDFGEVREGWLADLVLIDGDPLEDISILVRPEENLSLVMKGGRIVHGKAE